MRDLGPHQAGAVLGCGDLHRAACVEHGDDERLDFLLDGFRQRGIEDLAGDVEGQFSHFQSFLMRERRMMD